MPCPRCPARSAGSARCTGIPISTCATRTACAPWSGAFAHSNPLHFHDASGEGYRFLADVILALDPLNSQVAARMTSPFGAWRRQDPARQALMRGELARILANPELSPGTREVAQRSAATPS